MFNNYIKKILCLRLFGKDSNCHFKKHMYVHSVHQMYSVILYMYYVVHLNMQFQCA